LLDKLPGCKGAHPNRVAPEIEQAILDYSHQTNPWPAAGRARTGSARHQRQCGRCAWRVATSRLALQARPLVAP
jgi:hypothetical protein